MKSLARYFLHARVLMHSRVEMPEHRRAGTLMHSRVGMPEHPRAEAFLLRDAGQLRYALLF
jgi:hypothetical protein